MTYAHGLIDSESGARVVVGLDFYYLHKGDLWTSTHIVPELADNGTYVYVWTSGTTNHKHVSFNVTAGGDAFMSGYQSPTMAASGTAMSNFNRRRDGTNVTDVAIFNNGSISGGTLTGTMLFDLLLPGGRKSSAGGARGNSGGEWMVPASVGTFMLTVINQAGATKPIGVEFNWYEE